MSSSAERGPPSSGGCAPIVSRSIRPTGAGAPRRRCACASSPRDPRSHAQPGRTSPRSLARRIMAAQEAAMIVLLFKSQLRPDVDEQDYRATRAHMMDLVQKIPGFLSYKTFRADDGETVAIAKFETEGALEVWR